MATTAREILLILRGQNYASSAVRGASRDIARLGSGSNQARQLAMQRQQLQLVGQRLRQSRDIALAEKNSITEGSRRIAQEKAIAEQKIAQMRADSTLLRNQAQLSQATRAMQRGRPLRGFTLEETRKIQQARAIDVAAATASIEKQQIAIQELTAKEAALITREAQLTQIINTRSNAIELNTAKLRENELATNRATDSLTRLGNAGRTAEHIGRALTTGGIVGTVALGFAAKQAANINTQAVLAATQARPVGAPASVTTALASRISNQAVGLSQQFPAKVTDQIQAFYQVFSGTNIQKVPQATAFIKQLNEMAVAGGTDLATMSDAALTLYNNFGSLSQNANLFFSAVRYGRMNAGQFAASLANIIPIAKEAGYKFKDVADAMALLTRQTGSKFTSRDAQGLARLIQMLDRKEVQQGLQSRGISLFDNKGNIRPLMDVLTQIQQTFKLKPGPDTLNFFKMISGGVNGKGGIQGTIQGARAFSYLTQNIQQYHNVARLVNNDNDELKKSFEAMAKSPGVQWDVFTNKLRALVYLIGTQAIPVFMTLFKPIANLVQWFSRLNPHTQRMIALFLTIASVGALVVGVFGMIAGGIVSIASAIGLWTKYRAGVTLATTAVEGLGSEAGFIAAGPALGLGAIAAIPLLILYHKQVMEVINKLGGMKAVLIALSIIMGAFAVTKMVSGLAILDAELVASIGLVNALRASLLSIAGLTVVATVLILERHQIEKGLKDFTKKYIPGGDTSTGTGHWYSNGALGWMARNMGDHADRGVGGFLNKHLLGRDYSSYWKSRESKMQPDVLLNSPFRPGGKFGSLSALKDLKAGEAYIAKMKKATSEAAKSYNIPVTPTFSKLYDNVMKLNAVYQKSHSLKDWTNYYNALNKLQSYATDAETAYTKKMLDAQNSAVSQSGQINQATFQDVLSGIQGMYNNFLQQEQSAFGSLFQGPYMQSPYYQNMQGWGHKVTGHDVLQDLKSQVHQFTTFHALINSLKRRGAPQELLKELEAAGPSQIKEIGALSRLAPQQLNQYFQLFRRGQLLVHRQTMIDLNNQLDLYKKYGRNIAIAIITGLQSENVALTNSLTNMVRKMFPGLPVGATGAGGKPTHHTAKLNPKSATGGTTITHNSTYHVHTSDKATIPAQVRHAEFAKKAKYTAKAPPIK